VIQLNKPVTFLLPFHCYELEISHRLLESLGGVSRFILNALADGLDVLQMADVTGLTPSVLQHQLTFLEQHHFVSLHLTDGVPRATIVARGVRMVEVDRLLHSFSKTVWLDAFTLKHQAVHLLVPDDPEQLVRSPALAKVGQDTTVVFPERPRSYRNFDEFNRLRSLLKPDAFARLLEYFWKDAAQLVAEEMEHWEFSLRRQDSVMETAYLPVSFECSELSISVLNGIGTAGATLPPLQLPVLGLTHRFSRAEGFPWPVAVPPQATHYIELASNGALAPGLMPAHTTEEVSVTCAVIPADAATAVPANLPVLDIAPGLSTTLTVTRHRMTCAIDHVVLSERMHGREDALLFSFNFEQQEAELEAA
jgi:hypothetical protein